MNIPSIILSVLSILWCLIWSAYGAHINGLTTDGTTSLNNKKKYCGSHLTDALKGLCQGNYQTFPSRRRYWRSQYPYEDQLYYKRGYAATAGAKRRRRRGVYNECCEKPCSQQQLLMYCAEPSTVKSTTVR